MGSRFAKELRRIRGIKGASLRDVEKYTGISNTYLSQLETGKADKPSPEILKKLADYYKVPYLSFMESAGYLGAQKWFDVTNNTGIRMNQDVLVGANVKDKKKGKTLNSIESALINADLNEDELDKVAEFIQFLRSQRRRRRT